MRHLTDFVEPDDDRAAGARRPGPGRRRAAAPDGRAIGVIGIPGDRRDEDQREYGALAARLRRDHRARGREPPRPEPGETRGQRRSRASSAARAEAARPTRPGRARSSTSSTPSGRPCDGPTPGDLVVICVDDAVGVYREAMAAAGRRGDRRPSPTPASSRPPRAVRRRRSELPPGRPAGGAAVSVRCPTVSVPKSSTDSAPGGELAGPAGGSCTGARRTRPGGDGSTPPVHGASRVRRKHRRSSRRSGPARASRRSGSGRGRRGGARRSRLLADIEVRARTAASEPRRWANGRRRHGREALRDARPPRGSSSSVRRSPVVRRWRPSWAAPKQVATPLRDTGPAPPGQRRWRGLRPRLGPPEPSAARPVLETGRRLEEIGHRVEGGSRGQPRSFEPPSGPRQRRTTSRAASWRAPWCSWPRR